MKKSYLSKVLIRILLALTGLVVVTGCVTTEQKKPLLSGQVIDGQSGYPLADVYLAITYHSGQGTQACYASTMIQTNAQGYFDVPYSAAPDGAPVVEINPYKRGYIFIAFDRSTVIWPVGIHRNTLDLNADTVRQEQPVTAIKMHKNNMNPQLRLEYVAELADSKFECGDGESLAGYLAVVRAEVTDLEALGLQRDTSLISEWYGPGVEGLQRQSEALAMLAKSRNKAPSVKMRSKKRTLTVTPRQIADKRARERRRLERRKKLDEIRLKSQ